MSSYPWPLLRRTLLLWLSFLVIGLSDSVRGPTVLDLSDLVGVQLSQISSTFACRSGGGLLGSLVTGVFLDRARSSSRYLTLALAFLASSIFTAVLPHLPSLLLMQVTSFLFGLCNGVIHTAANVLLMDIWTGHDSSPYMYALHFCFAVGSLASPLLARPFIKDAGTTTILPAGPDEGAGGYMDGWELWEVRSLYPLIGLLMVVVVPGFLVHWRRDARLEGKLQGVLEDRSVEEREEMEETGMSSRRYLLVGLMSVYYFTFAGVEGSFRSFISAFGVSSSLQLSRTEGSDLLAVFYLAFAFFRGLLIPLSMKVRPVVMLWASLALLLLATICLSLWAEHSLMALTAATAMAGAAVASVFASGMLWTKEQMPVTNRISSVFTMSCSIACQLYAMLIGCYMESFPMMFPYTMLGSVVGLLVSFSLASMVAASLRRQGRGSL